MTLSIVALTVSAQRVELLKQQKLSQWAIAPGNYSGITPLGNDRYAVVSDKDSADGFHIWKIELNSGTGIVTNVEDEGFFANPTPKVNHNGISLRDCEDIVYFKPANTVFICGEGDQEILEYAMDGKPTGRRLEVPAMFGKDKISANLGFEALAYDEKNHYFWTMTESTLPADGLHTSPQTPSILNVMRLLCFNDSLKCIGQYAYRMNVGTTKKDGTHYAYGVPAMTVLPDGTLLVMEREANVSTTKLRGETFIRIFTVEPTKDNLVEESESLRNFDITKFVQKRQLTSFSTKVNPPSVQLANYEGMCVGPTLEANRRTLLLLNDSQNNAGIKIAHLKDYIKVVILYQ